MYDVNAGALNAYGSSALYDCLSLEWSSRVVFRVKPTPVVTGEREFDIEAQHIAREAVNVMICHSRTLMLTAEILKSFPDPAVS